MDAYGIDLRERVLMSCDEGVCSQPEIAEEFDVSVSFITKLLRRRRKTGSIGPKPHAGGRKAKLDGHEETLRELLRRHFDATLQELCREGPVRVSVATMCRALRRLKLTRKKSRFMPTNATRPASVCSAGSSSNRCER